MASRAERTTLATAGRASLSHAAQQQQERRQRSLERSMLDTSETTFDSGGNGASYSFSAALAAQQQQRYRGGGRRGAPSGSQTDRSGAASMNLLDSFGASFTSAAAAAGSLSARSPRRTDMNSSGSSVRHGASQSDIELDARSDFYLEQLAAQRASQLPSSSTYANQGGEHSSPSAAARSSAMGYAMGSFAATPASSSSSYARSAHQRHDHSPSRQRFLSSHSLADPPSLWSSASMQLLPSLRLFSATGSTALNTAAAVSPGKSRSPQRAPSMPTLESPGRGGGRGEQVGPSPALHVLNRHASQARAGLGAAQSTPVQPVPNQQLSPAPLRRTQQQTQPQQQSPRQFPRARQAIVAPAPSDSWTRDAEAESGGGHGVRIVDGPSAVPPLHHVASPVASSAAVAAPAAWTPLAGPPSFPPPPVPAPLPAPAVPVSPHAGVYPTLVTEEEIAECIAMLQDDTCTLLRASNPSPPDTGTPAPSSPLVLSRADAVSILSSTSSLSHVGAHVATPFHVLNLLRSFVTIGYDFWRGATPASPSHAADHGSQKPGSFAHSGASADRATVFPLRTQVERLCSALRESTSLREALLLFLLSPRCALFAHASVPTMINAESVQHLLESVALSLRTRGGAAPSVARATHASAPTLLPAHLREPVGLEREIWALCQSLNARAAGAQPTLQFQHFNQVAREIAALIAGTSRDGGFVDSSAPVAQGLNPSPRGAVNASPASRMHPSSGLGQARGSSGAPDTSTTGALATSTVGHGQVRSSDASAHASPVRGLVVLSTPPAAGIPFPSWPAKPAPPALPVSPRRSVHGDPSGAQVHPHAPSTADAGVPVVAVGSISKAATLSAPTSPAEPPQQQPKRIDATAPTAASLSLPAAAGGGKGTKPTPLPMQAASPRATAAPTTAPATPAARDGLRQFGSPTALRRQVLSQQAQIASLEQALAAAVSQAERARETGRLGGEAPAAGPSPPSSATGTSSVPVHAATVAPALDPSAAVTTSAEKQHPQQEVVAPSVPAPQQQPQHQAVSASSSPVPSGAPQVPSTPSPRCLVPVLPASRAMSPVGGSAAPLPQQQAQQRMASPAPEQPDAGPQQRHASVSPSSLSLQRKLLRMHLCYACTDLWSGEFAPSVSFPPSDSARALTDAQLDQLLATATTSVPASGTDDSARRAIALVDRVQPRRNQIGSFDSLLRALHEANPTSGGPPGVLSFVSAGV